MQTSQLSSTSLNGNRKLTKKRNPEMEREIKNILNQKKPKRGRPIKHPRSTHCTHLNRPEHANGVCYQCSSNINNQHKRIKNDMEKKKELKKKQQKQREREKALLNKMVGEGSSSSSSSSSSSNSMVVSLPSNEDIEAMNQRVLSEIHRFVTPPKTATTVMPMRPLLEYDYSSIKTASSTTTNIVDEDDNEENMSLEQEEECSLSSLVAHVSSPSSNEDDEETGNLYSYVIQIEDQVFIFNPKGTQHAVILLNVGGTLFQTNLQTLFNYPSKLTTLIMDLSKLQNNSGIVFIDRDPTFFRWILNFLRDKTLFVFPSELIEKEQLLVEAKFYEIEPLIDLLTEAINLQTNKSKK